jgi:RHS repeat-associated protein
VPTEPVFYYYLSDHLGSSNITTDRSGNVIQHYEYLAYGGERYSENNASGHPEFNLTHRFTGQAVDDETGLYYFNSRYYDPELGRFIQADTITPSVADCQSLNRYSYCLNSPINYTDPSGHFVWMAALVAALEAGAVGAVVGGIVGGAISGMTGGNVGAGILGGAAAGFITGFGIGAGGQIAVGCFHVDSAIGASIGGALGGAGGGAASSAIQGGNIAVGTIMGAISGAITGALDPLDPEEVDFIKESHPGATNFQETPWGFSFDQNGVTQDVIIIRKAPGEAPPAAASQASAGPREFLTPNQASGVAGFLHGVDIALNVASFIPGPIGAVGSIGSAVFALARGEYGSAALDLAGVIPGGKIAAAALKEIRAVRAIKAVTMAEKAEVAVARGEATVERLCSRGCFAAGTTVSTPEGDVNIEDVKVGDTVYAFDIETGKVVESKVTETLRNFTYCWVEITIGNETIMATRGHMFWEEDKKAWVKAVELAPGMSIRLQNGEISKIATIQLNEIDAPETTYNLIVDRFHDYFVGQNQVLVHNGYPESPAYPPPTQVGETFQFNFDGSPNYEASRAAGVARARAAGAVKPGEIGHHINSVSTHPHLAAEPSNIEGVANRAEHLKIHGGSWRNPTSGQLRLLPGC